MARGPHGKDAELFAERWHEPLRAAAADLSWLLTRRYAAPSALKLVGDRHRLRSRQRLAVCRSACADAARQARRRRRLSLEQLSGRPLAVDGFNCLITVETAISGGLILRGRDGACRDLASVHGSYRTTALTSAAIEVIARVLADARVGPARWYLDRPVSNSGRLRQQLAQMAAANGWRWTVELLPDPDPALAGSGAVVASSDAWVLDRCDAWVDLPAAAIAARIPGAWMIALDEAS